MEVYNKNETPAIARVSSSETNEKIKMVSMKSVKGSSTPTEFQPMRMETREKSRNANGVRPAGHVAGPAPGDCEDMSPSEIVLLTKSDGPLTKEIRLDENGVLHSDGSACVMSRGSARRVPIPDIVQLGELINGLEPNQALTLGSLRPDLPDEVEVATKAIVAQRAINGTARRDIISRSADNIVFKSGQRGFVLLDFDTKGMPAEIAEQLKRAGGLWPALLSVIPELDSVARLARASTSAGLYDQSTGTWVPGSNGEHVYLSVRDVADSARFLKALHARCWLAGYGWMLVGRSGQMLERSIVDRSVGAPERLVFEGVPVLVEPLAQDAEARRPRITEGKWLDTLVACPPLTIAEMSQVDELRRKAKHQLDGSSAKALEEFIGTQADALVKRSGVTMRVARETIHRQCSGELLPSIALPFDDPTLTGKTVADVLADPAAFEGETLADPLEGIDYGRCKAKIMRRRDGTPWIHSFAHGRTVYELMLDAATVRTAISTADKGDVLSLLAELLVRAVVSPAEEEDLKAYARGRTGTAPREFARQFKKACEAKAEDARKEAHERRMAERTDPRPMLPVPARDAEWLPQMSILNGVLGKSRDRNPPARDIEGNLVRVRRIALKGMHAFVSANEDGEVTKAAPPQLLIHRLSEPEAAEMIERYIEHVDKAGRSVQYAMPFVRHYMDRDDNILPIIAAVATLPIVSTASFSKLIPA
jgi:hypothetical protein